jgi:preprotein translocase subunit SecF
MKRKALCCGVSLLVITLGSGCRLAELMRENTEGIKVTNEAIAKNSAAMAGTTQAIQDLRSPLQQVGSLNEPMRNLAALGPTFNRVAELDGPMTEVADLRDPMVRVAELKASLDQVAKLDKPMSALSRVTGAQLAAAAILAIVAFFALLFLTVWAAVRLALRHRPRN